MKKAFALVVVVMCAVLMVSCGKEDPLNRVEAYVEVDMQDGNVEVYGANNGAYEPNYFTTKTVVEAQSKAVVEALESYIMEKIPDEEVGEVFYYVEKIEGEGYTVDVFYQSLSKGNSGYSLKGKYYYQKVFYFAISANDEENQELYKLLKLEEWKKKMRIIEMTRIATSFLMGVSGN